MRSKTKTKIHRLEGFKRGALAKKFAEEGLNKGAEIGVRSGRYSQVLCEANPNLELISVDPYNVVYEDYRSKQIGDEEQERFFQDATKLLKPYNCKIIRKTGLEAVRDVPYESLDFVYIDGGHELDAVMVDIIEWSKRVRVGGIVAGHDYYKFRIGNVTEAVDVYCYAHRINDLYLTDERTPSWWFTRPKYIE